MELTVSRFLQAALPAFVLFLVLASTQSDAQKIVSYPSTTGSETKDFPRRKELLQALDFLEEYGRGRENDWDIDWDIDEMDGLSPAVDFDNNVRQPENRLDDFGLGDDMDNEVDGLPWMEDDVAKVGPYETVEEERLKNMLHNYDYEELLEVALEEEELEAEEEEIAEEDILKDALEREEEEIANIVEEEMEEIAVDNILDDLWAEELLQEDAEDQLKWLLQEEEERELADDEDPFEYFYSDDAESSDASDNGEQSEGVLGGDEEGLEPAYADYSADISVDYRGESLDEEEKEELLEEAAELLELEDEDSEEWDTYKKLQAEKLLQGIINTLTSDAVVDEEGDYMGSYDGLGDGEGGEGEGDEQDEQDEEEQSSSVLEAGMGGEEEDFEDEADLNEKVYDELMEFVDDEIDQAIENIVDDIVRELDKEGNEASESSDEGEYDDEEDYESSETSSAEDDAEETSERSEVDTDVNAECPSLQYFIDDCNIVNNYADLGADGYKDIFAGACNRHQLCYTCGSYYGVDAKLCDELFKAEILSRCLSSDADCKQRAKYFWLVARNNRVHVPDSPSVCGDPCLLNFLVEV